MDAVALPGRAARRLPGRGRAQRRAPTIHKEFVPITFRRAALLGLATSALLLGACANDGSSRSSSSMGSSGYGSSSTSSGSTGNSGAGRTSSMGTSSDSASSPNPGGMGGANSRTMGSDGPGGTTPIGTETGLQGPVSGTAR